MKGDLTAIIEKAPEGGFWAICPEVPGLMVRGKPLRRLRRASGRL
jgi:predicted RNase H-like HicB family nuclease